MRKNVVTEKVINSGLGCVGFMPFANRTEKLFFGKEMI